MSEIKFSKDGTSIEEIISEWLKENHYDGLCNPYEECACGFDDFIPCRCAYPKECVCAYKVPNPDGSDDPYFCTSNSDQDFPSEIRLTLEQCYQQLAEVAREMWHYVVAHNTPNVPGIDMSGFEEQLEELGVEL